MTVDTLGIVALALLWFGIISFTIALALLADRIECRAELERMRRAHSHLDALDRVVDHQDGAA